MEVGLHQILVHMVVGVLHVHVEGVLHAQVVELGPLDAGVDAHGAHAHIGSAAGGAGLFQQDGFQPPLAQGDGGGQTGGAAGYDDNIGGQGFHNLHLLLLDGCFGGLGLGDRLRHGNGRRIDPLASGGTGDGPVPAGLLCRLGPLDADGMGGQLGRTAGALLYRPVGAEVQTLAAAGTIKAVDDRHIALAGVDAVGGTDLSTGALSPAEGGVYVELGKSQAHPGGTGLGFDVGVHLVPKSIQQREHRQARQLAQSAVAAGGHSLADLPGQLQALGLGPAALHLVQDAGELIQPLPAEGTLAAALIPQTGNLLIRLMDGTVPAGQPVEHAALQLQLSQSQL